MALWRESLRLPQDALHSPALGAEMAQGNNGMTTVGTTAHDISPAMPPFTKISAPRNPVWPRRIHTQLVPEKSRAKFAFRPTHSRDARR